MNDSRYRQLTTSRFEDTGAGHRGNSSFGLECPRANSNLGLECPRANSNLGLECLRANSNLGFECLRANSNRGCKPSPARPEC